VQCVMCAVCDVCERECVSACGYERERACVNV